MQCVNHDKLSRPFLYHNIIASPGKNIPETFFQTHHGRVQCRRTKAYCNFNQTPRHSFGDIKPGPNWLRGLCASYVTPCYYSLSPDGGSSSSNRSRSSSGSGSSSSSCDLTIDQLPEIRRKNCLHGGKFSLEKVENILAVMCQMKYLLFGK